MFATDGSRDHLGGFNVVDGQTIQVKANWEEGAVVFSVVTSGDNATPQLTADDGIVFEIFGAAYYSERVESYGGAVGGL